MLEGKNEDGIIQMHYVGPFIVLMMKMILKKGVLKLCNLNPLLQ
jgi:hypothetical protein